MSKTHRCPECPQHAEHLEADLCPSCGRCKAHCHADTHQPMKRIGEKAHA